MEVGLEDVFSGAVGGGGGLLGSDEEERPWLNPVGPGGDAGSEEEAKLFKSLLPRQLWRRSSVEEGLKEDVNVGGGEREVKAEEKKDDGGVKKDDVEACVEAIAAQICGLSNDQGLAVAARVRKCAEVFTRLANRLETDAESVAYDSGSSAASDAGRGGPLSEEDAELVKAVTDRFSPKSFGKVLKSRMVPAEGKPGWSAFVDAGRNKRNPFQRKSGEGQESHEVAWRAPGSRTRKEVRRDSVELETSSGVAPRVRSSLDAGGNVKAEMQSGSWVERAEVDEVAIEPSENAVEPSAGSAASSVSGLEGFGDDEASEGMSVVRGEEGSEAESGDGEEVREVEQVLSRRLFGSVKEPIYRHLASILAKHKEEPFFLLQVFRSIEQLDTVYLRQRLLLSLDEIAREREVLNRMPRWARSSSVMSDAPSERDVERSERPGSASRKWVGARGDVAEEDRSFQRDGYGGARTTAGRRESVGSASVSVGTEAADFEVCKEKLETRVIALCKEALKNNGETLWKSHVSNLKAFVVDLFRSHCEQSRASDSPEEGSERSPVAQRRASRRGTNEARVEKLRVMLDRRLDLFVGKNALKSLALLRAEVLSVFQESLPNAADRESSEAYGREKRGGWTSRSMPSMREKRVGSAGRGRGGFGEEEVGGLRGQGLAGRFKVYAKERSFSMGESTE
ncbi:hypothetical protein HDU96_010604 [Phlyctochytrium bullatum]|nr:hypothetical protein HDU96_010604 [Phlyctochytrium bullatum]